MSDAVLADLVAMSNRLGDPANDFAILGEGNTSARMDDETFCVKASGTELRTITAEGFVRVRFSKVLELLDATDISDAAVKKGFADASVNANGRRPSVEALLHAIMLSMEGVNFVAHTHPTAINIITCARDGQKAFEGRIFPDEIVCCGVAPVWIPYTDPGVPLARKVKAEVEAYVERYGMRPKTILVQNHGLITLGGTPAEVENATHMACKTARILVGTYALGGPNFFSQEQVDAIFARPDEKYRMAILEKRG
jgi:rhamnose utilization protein RhaD (predicted bifunctional aldolase and dehydrogenase)